MIITKGGNKEMLSILLQNKQITVTTIFILTLWFIIGYQTVTIHRLKETILSYRIDSLKEVVRQSERAVETAIISNQNSTESKELEDRLNTIDTTSIAPMCTDCNFTITL